MPAERVEAAREGAIVALAGRRVDAPNASATRFPPNRVPEVRRTLQTYLRATSVRALVCSAACGADLLGLAVAGDCGIERHVILPYDIPAFRSTSVVDRPGPWGRLFDEAVHDASRRGTLIVLNGTPGDPASYALANSAIVERAAALACGNAATRHHRHKQAVVIWEGAPRGDNDITEDFRRRAEAANFHVTTILTV